MGNEKQPKIYHQRHNRNRATTSHSGSNNTFGDLEFNIVINKAQESIACHK